MGQAAGEGRMQTRDVIRLMSSTTSDNTRVVVKGRRGNEVGRITRGHNGFLVLEGVGSRVYGRSCRCDWRFGCAESTNKGDEGE